jgi:hypothetical protein
MERGLPFLPAIQAVNIASTTRIIKEEVDLIEPPLLTVLVVLGWWSGR